MRKVEDFIPNPEFVLVHRKVIDESHVGIIQAKNDVDGIIVSHISKGCAVLYSPDHVHCTLKFDDGIPYDLIKTDLLYGSFVKEVDI